MKSNVFGTVSWARLGWLLVFACLTSAQSPAGEGATAAESSPEGKRAFRIEDIYRVKWPSSPEVSPDGKWVVFGVTESDLPNARRNADIFLMGVDGSGLKRLTRWLGYDGQPSFSKDGKSIFFVSSRSGSVNLFRLPLEGGDAQQLTHFASGIGGYVQSPAGAHLAFDATVFPECDADDACNTQLEALRSEGPLQAHVADDLLYRHWDDWRDARVSRIFLLDLESLEVKPVTSGKHDAPGFNLNGPDGYQFSPDGTEFCFTSDHEPDPATSTNVDLWVVPVSGGEPRNITRTNRGWDGVPRYSPDGRYIAYLTQKTAGYESALISIALYDRGADSARVSSGSFDNWVSQFAWHPSGRRIYFTADVEGRLPIHELDVKSGRVRDTLSFDTIDDFALGPDGRFAVMTRRAVGAPPELYRCDLRPGKPARNVRRLTELNGELEREVDIRPAEEMWVTGANGVRIHVFVVKPFGFEEGKKYPLILSVHGGPQSQWYDAYRSGWQLFPGAGYVIAFCNPHGSTGYGQDFTAQISGDWGGQNFEDLMHVTDALEALPYVDGDRMGAMGWSYGGYMMNWFQGHTSRFKALATMMGIYDLRSFYGATEELWWPEWDLEGTPWTSELYEKWSPSSFVEQFETPMLLLTGTLDFRIPYTQSLQMFTALRKRNVPARLVVMENNGHWPDPLRAMALYYTAHLEWFHEYLGGAASPWSTADFAYNRVFEEDKASVREK